MADPLSISASIITLIQTADAVVQCLKSSTGASKEITDIRLEVINVRGLLFGLRDLLPDPQSKEESLTPVLESLGGPHGPLKQFQTVLEDLASQLALKEGIRKGQQILGWHFQKNSVKAVLDKITRYKGLFTLALQNDQLGLSKAMAKTMTKVKADLADIKSGVQDLKNAQEDSLTREALKHRREILTWFSHIDISANHEAAPGSGKTVLCSTSIQEIKRICKEDPDKNALAYFYFTFREKEKQTVVGFLGSIVAQIAATHESLPDEIVNIYEQKKESNSRPSAETLLKCLGNMLKLPGQKYIIVDALDECDERETLLEILSDLWDLKVDGIHILVTSRPEIDIVQELRPNLTQELSLAESKINDDIALHINKQVFKDPKLKGWPKKVKIEMEKKLREKAQGMFRWVYCQLKTLKSCRKLSVLRETLDQLPKDLDETYSRIIEGIHKHHAKEALKALQWLAFSVRPLTLAELAEAAVLESNMGSLEDRDPLRDPSDILAICSSLVVVSKDDTFHELAIEDVDEYQDGGVDNGSIWSSDNDGTEDQGKGDGEDLRTGNYREDIGKEEEEEEEEGEEDGGDGEDEESEEGDGGYTKISGNSVVTFAHFSVKEYLTSDRVRVKQGPGSIFCFSELTAHSFITKSCLSHLLHFRSRRTSEKDFPLYEYAAKHWPKHARIAESYASYSGDTVSLALQLLNPRNRAFIHWIRYRYSEKASASDATPLYYAARLCLPATVRELLKLPDVDVNALGGRKQSPLAAAASWQPDPVRQTELDGVADEPSQAVARQLLENGANIEAKDGGGNTALHVAGNSGNEYVLQLLLNRGATIEARNDDKETPLHTAGDKGHLNIVRLLTERGADVHGKDKRGMTPLHKVAMSGHRTVAELLIEHGAVVDQPDDEEGVTPLHCAAARGHPEVADLLLEKGANVEAKSNAGWGPLQLGARHEAVMRVLLKHGADVNARADGHTALYYATMIAGHIRVLLEAGANLNDVPRRKAGYWISQSSFSSTLLEICRWKEKRDLLLAASGGNLLAVRQLLQDGQVDIHAKDSRGRTALLVAVHRGGYPWTIIGGHISTKSHYPLEDYVEIVELLIKNGADIEAKDSEGRTSLHTAVEGCLNWGSDDKMINLLSEKGANLESTDATGMTPLQFAIHEWDEAQRRWDSMEKAGRHRLAVGALLERGADSEKVDARKLEALLETAWESEDEENPQELRSGEESESRWADIFSSGSQSVN